MVGTWTVRGSWKRAEKLTASESVDGRVIMQQMNVVSKDTLSADIDRAMREAVAAILKNVAILPEVEQQSR